MSNKKLNWSHDEDHFTKKSSLFKKVFQGSTKKTQKQIDDTSNLIGLNITGNMSMYFETLRDSLLQTKDSSSQLPSLIAIISCYKGEGVSTIASNLAAMLAQSSDNHVLLVDVNYRDPSAHQILGVSLSPGLGEVIFNGQDIKTVIQPTVIDNLFILSAGEIEKDSNINFDSQAFTDLLHTLKHDYSFVIFDSPAIGATSSSVRLAGLLDGVILVAESERVRWEAAQRVKGQLVKANANILGVVLNKKQFHIPRWLYKTL